MTKGCMGPKKLGTTDTTVCKVPLLITLSVFGNA